MTVFVVGYKGSDTDDILGVYSDIEMAKDVMRKDYEETEIFYEPTFKQIENNYIFLSNDNYFDEWYIHETELK